MRNIDTDIFYGKISQEGRIDFFTIYRDLIRFEKGVYNTDMHGKKKVYEKQCVYF